MKLSILYVTARREPRIDWILTGLAEQTRNDDTIELIVIDLHGRALEALGERVVSAEHYPVGRIKVVEPKPNIWQGAHRVTSVDWWAKSNALNTGIALASHDYIAAVDDRCKLGPQWLAAVRLGEIARTHVLCGSYDRLESGKVVPDGRRAVAPTGRMRCGGSWLYGCTWAMPLEWALGVNGFEEGCDGLGGEDYIFGLNLHHAGRRLDFVPSLMVELERSPQFSVGDNGHAISPSPKRTDKGVSPHDKSHAALARFGQRSRTEFTPDLRALRRIVRRGEPWPIPDRNGDHRDWFDGASIKDM